MTVAAPTPTSSVRAIIEARRARSSARARVSTAVGPITPAMGRAYGSPHGCAHRGGWSYSPGATPQVFEKMPLIRTVVCARSPLAVLLGPERLLGGYRMDAPLSDRPSMGSFALAAEGTWSLDGAKRSSTQSNSLGRSGRT